MFRDIIIAGFIFAVASKRLVPSPEFEAEIAAIVAKMFESATGGKK